MKKYIFLILFFWVYLLNAQQKKQELTLSYKDITRIEVIKKIEEKTSYRFYFVDDWLKDNTLVSGNYVNAQLSEILDNLFTSTLINYYIHSETKVILSLNSVIHNTFPNLVWENNEKEEIKNNPKSTPIFYSAVAEGNSLKTQVIRIGKESKNATQKRYTLKGFAKNVSTGEVIPNLVLMVQNSKISAVTNDTGFYSIQLPVGVNVIEATSLGFSNLEKTIIIYNNGNYNFLMKESSVLLDELIIEAGRDKNVNQAVTGVTSIKIQNIKNIPLILGERDILKVATALPGIKKTGEGSAGFSVRGGKEDQNLILLDNAVLYNPSHFFGIFSGINPFTSGDVDIYKGSIPPEYGGRLSSVFDIKTKEASFEEFKGEAAIGPVTSNLALQIPIVKEKSNLIIGGRGTYSNWLLKSIKDENLSKSSASFFDTNLKYTHKISKNDRLDISGYYSNDSFSITSDSLQTYSNRLFSVKWNHKFDEKNSGDLILANSDYKFNLEFDENSINDFELDYRINETELKLKMKYLANEQHKFEYGISNKLFNVSPGNIKPKGNQSIVAVFDTPKERGVESAIFISDNYKINKKLQANIGFRYSFFTALGPSTQNVYDSNSPKNESSIIDVKTFGNNEVVKTYGGPEIRSSIRYSLTPSFSVKAGFNNTYQYIHTLSNNTTASPTDTWRLSNYNIKPQQANQFSFGLFKNINGNEYEISLESYYKTSKNILDYKVGASLMLNQNIESDILQGKGKAYGIEFLAKKNKGRLNGWFGYSYSRSYIQLDSQFREERVNNGNYFPANFDKPHDLNIVANYKITKRYSFSANFAYQTGRPVTYPIGSFMLNGEERVLYSDRNKFRIPDYFRLDIGFNVEGNHKIKKPGHGFWNVSVYNVLGRNNPYSVFFVTEAGEIKAYKSSIFAFPIPTITYNISF
ncbi:TonB-dependent receptor [Polaribacter reichenbachii]|uniref:TonB-dependent receptor n=1 Tax=Polaribacter reichenbachii TaxID=996801 RepID=A0A1B8TQB7_9FLAO|nr:carboxypeptidase-like regulatory domain-containing protein [Polaribacter reichenbachii]APZ48133.1 TonB-dependent receptor [Polaribacter reichenbachii]AUC20400.1 TonB-dependent receptor [Polaribacter reichenbachii]OBY61805.1 TonB-dependent receptor [Polaribacter reichenbachii]